MIWHEFSRRYQLSGTLDYGRHPRTHEGQTVRNLALHRAETNTGCICSDGQYHRCLDCIEPDCVRTEEEIRRRDRHA